MRQFTFPDVLLERNASASEFPKFINRHLQAGADPGLEFGGLNCLFHVNSFLTLLFAIGNIAVWGACPLDPSLLATYFI